MTVSLSRRLASTAGVLLVATFTAGCDGQAGSSPPAPPTTLETTSTTYSLDGVMLGDCASAFVDRFAGYALDVHAAIQVDPHTIRAPVRHYANGAVSGDPVGTETCTSDPMTVGLTFTGWSP
jgi:hypothetical protein